VQSVAGRQSRNATLRSPTAFSRRVEATAGYQNKYVEDAGNWFPRGRARLNGRTTPIALTDDGCMRVPIPAVPVELVLDYVLDASISAHASGHWPGLPHSCCCVSCR